MSRNLLIPTALLVGLGIASAPAAIASNGYSSGRTTQDFLAAGTNVGINLTIGDTQTWSTPSGAADGLGSITSSLGAPSLKIESTRKPWSPTSFPAPASRGGGAKPAVGVVPEGPVGAIATTGPSAPTFWQDLGTGLTVPQAEASGNEISEVESPDSSDDMDRVFPGSRSTTSDKSWYLMPLTRASWGAILIGLVVAFAVSALWVQRVLRDRRRNLGMP